MSLIWRLVLLIALAIPSASAAPIISEFMAANATTLADEDGDFSDWIEIQNPGPGAINLAGWFLTDDPNVRTKWAFPSTNLTSGARLVLFASGKDRRTPGRRLHTNFQLSSDGEYLALSQTDGPPATVFSPAFPKQHTDVSYGLVGNTGTNGFLATATPGSANTATAAEFVADTKFSHHRGFYSTNFSLEISCATAGGSIFYTTNGSTPSATNGALYTAPIAITGTKVIRARAEKSGQRPSNVDTETYLFLADIIKQSTNGVAPPGWPTTWGDNVVDYGMDPDIVAKAPWSGTISNDLKSIPTLSLVMRLDDLFNAQTGIYANAGGEGREWERPCSLELIYPDGRDGFALRSGIRVRGGFSRTTSNPKHSLRFLTRDEYGDTALRFPFFGPKAASSFERFDLRTSQDGSWAFLGDPNGLFLNDPFTRDTLLALGQPGEHGDWYHLYINGQYWGLYNSCERPEASFAASYLGGAEENWDVLKPDPQLGYVMKVTDGNDEAWTRLWRAATNGFASNSAYFKVQGKNADGSINPAFENLLDVTNLIDYLLVIFWVGDFDGPLYGGFTDGFLNNFYALRDRTGTNGGFRFITHDAELSLGSLDENRISTTTIGDPARGDDQDRCNPYYLWTRLLPNAEFKMLVADRAQKHFFGSGALTRDAATARFAARTNEIFHAITGESARWGDAQRPNSPITPENWLNAINDKMEGYFPYRANTVLDQLRDAALFPTDAAPVFSRDGGEVPVGTTVALAHTNPVGEIFFTTDGSDPRAIGGALGESAINFDGPYSITGSVTIRARVRDGGAWSPLVEASFFPLQNFSGLRITELNYNPLGAGTIAGDEFEFLELKNTDTNAVDVGGAFFDGITYTFPVGTKIQPGGFYVIARSATNFHARYPSAPLHGIYTGKLDNSGEKIALKTSAGVEVLSVTYGDRAPWPATPDGFGFSLVQTSSGQWRASSSPNGSPGADDPSATIPPVVINEILTHTDLPLIDAIELFNPTASDVDLSGWYVSDDGGLPRKFRIPDGTTLPAGGYIVFTENEFNTGPYAFSLSSMGDEVYLFSGAPGGTNLTGYNHGVKLGAAENGVTFGRYINTAGEEMFPAQIEPTLGGANAGPRVGPAVINEIHYHPAANYDEFIEIANITDAPLNLFDSLRPSNTWRLNGLAFVFPTNVTLSARGLALIVGINPEAFRSKYSVPQSVPVFGPFPGKLQDSGERLELQRPDAPGTNGVIPFITVDAVRYKDRVPWPVAADGDGPALQRLNASAFGDDPSNWSASGLTPGRANHLNQLPTVSLTMPASGAEFTLPTAITLEADPRDVDGTITKVEFFDGSQLIGEATNAPYRMTWFTPVSGSRQLFAKARDNELGSSLSAPLAVMIHAPVIGSGFGLRAEYFNAIDFSTPTVRRVDSNIDFTWSDEPLAGISADGFAVRWSGRLQAISSGAFTVNTVSADGVRLWIDGVKLIDNWTDHLETENSAPINLEAGHLYDLRLEYYNAGGLARIQLAWSAAGLPRQAIPREQLYPPVNSANQPPQIQWISPASNSGVSPGNVPLTVNVSDRDGAIQKVRFFANGAPVGESAVPPFNFTWFAPTRGDYLLSATAIDDNLAASSAFGGVLHVVNGYATNQIILPVGATWKYWDKGSLPAANWNQPLFDDSAWSSGPAQLGYGDGDEATTLSFGPNASDKYITSYFRSSVNIDSPEAITGLQARLVRDDGVAIYLNGSEIFRDNLPAGLLDYGTLALTTFGAPDENAFIAADLAPPGPLPATITVAAEIHQGARDSSDISFDLELTAIRSVLAPFVRVQPTSLSASPGASIFFQVNAGGAQPLSYQWRRNDANLPGQTSSILQITNFQSTDLGSYSVIIQNSLGSATSLVATASFPIQASLTASLNHGLAQLQFLSAAGFTNALEWSPTIAPTIWMEYTNFPPQPAAAPIELEIPITSGAARFFRLRTN